MNAMARLTRTPLCCAALLSFARGRNRQEGGDYEVDDKEAAMGLTKRKSAPSSSLMIEPSANAARKLGRPPKRRKTEGAAHLSMFGASFSLSLSIVSCLMPAFIVIFGTHPSCGVGRTSEDGRSERTQALSRVRAGRM